jgi:hypothetical protein
MASPAFAIYAALFARAEQMGPRKKPTNRRAMYVHERRAPDGASNFNPTWANGWALLIHNPDLKEPKSKPIDDARVVVKLITLAHEIGHATSCETNADGVWDEYFAALNHRYEVIQRASAELGAELSPEEAGRAIVAAVCHELTERERELIWNEEKRAWRLAEATLRATSFDDWSIFEKRRGRGVRTHGIILGLVAPEPGDLAKLMLPAED